MDELKPCPFCGGKAKLEDMGFPHHVFCTKCSARITGQGFAEDGEKDAILKWNRRIGTDRFDKEDKNGNEDAGSGSKS